MKNYPVTICVKAYYTTNIEANSSQEALSLAKDYYNRNGCTQYDEEYDGAELEECDDDDDNSEDMEVEEDD